MVLLGTFGESLFFNQPFLSLDFIDLVENVYDSLKSLNYIDELQKFRQDDYYKQVLLAILQPFFK